MTRRTGDVSARVKATAVTVLAVFVSTAAPATGRSSVLPAGLAQIKAVQ